jgi:hypothetical protein
VPCFGGRCRRVAEWHDHVDPARHQFVDETRQAVEVKLCPAALEGHIAVEHIAALCEAADQMGHDIVGIGGPQPAPKQPEVIDLGKSLVGSGTR